MMTDETNDNAKRLNEIHNTIAPLAIEMIYDPIVAAGGQAGTVMVVLESVIIGVLLKICTPGSEEKVIEMLAQSLLKGRMPQVRERQKQIAEVKQTLHETMNATVEQIMRGGKLDG